MTCAVQNVRVLCLFHKWFNTFFFRYKTNLRSAAIGSVNTRDILDH